MKTLVIDTETTGLDVHADDVLEIGICDLEGNTICNMLVKPARVNSWVDAEQIHGITPEMVENADTLEAIKTVIQDIVADADLVFYNADYDATLLESVCPGILDTSKNILCAMQAWAEYKDVRRSDGNYKWHKLESAANEVGHIWAGNSHRAINDALATADVWKYLIDKNCI